MAANWEDSSERPAGSPLSADIGARVAAIVHAAEREAQVAERAIADRRRAAEEEVERYLAATRLRADAEAAARAARLEALSVATRRLAAELSDATSALTHELARAEEDVASTLPRTPWPAAPARSEPRPTPVEPSTAPAAEPAAAEPAMEPTWTRNEPVDEPAPAAQETVVAEPAAEAPRREAAPFDDERGLDDELPLSSGTIGAEVPSAARLVAIEMAVGGSSRAEVEQHLREQLGASDPQELLDDVFGVASHAGSTLAWGQP